MADILVIEDDVTFTKTLEGFLKKHGFTIEIAHSVKNGKQTLSCNTFQLILLDYKLPDGTGLDLLQFLVSENIKTPVILMTSFNDVRTAVLTMKLGAHDYLIKPIIPEEIIFAINGAIKNGGAKPKKQPTKSELFIDGSSEKSLKITEYIKLVAPTEMSVLIQGESGTGKEQIARRIHQKSKRSNKPFVAIDCGALSNELAVSELFGHEKGAYTGAVTDKKGQFEFAHEGTLFLDEIGNLNYEVQIKLLRALQEKVITPLGSLKTIKIDVRIIAATNDELKTSNFREDLYHRLNEFMIIVPPLRHLGDDIEEYIAHFIKLSNIELGKNVKGVSKEVLDVFLKYKWPGNLRELKNTIKRAVLLSTSNTIEKEALPEELIEEVTNTPYLSEYNLKEFQQTNEREIIIKTLKETNNNKAKAARLLNIDRKTLYMKLDKYGIDI